MCRFRASGYVHHFKLNDQHGFNIGITSDNQTTSYRYDATSAGLNLAYFFVANAKNAISVGITPNFSALQGRYAPDIQCLENCPVSSEYKSTVAIGMNLGIMWKNKTSPTANFSLALVGHNTNNPISYYTFYRNEIQSKPVLIQRLPDYMLIANADFMVSQRIGFAPILIVKAQGIKKYEYSMLAGTDLIYKINYNKALYFGLTQQFKSEVTYPYPHFSIFGLRYKTPKISVGLSYNTLIGRFTSPTIRGFPNFQVGLGYNY